MNNQDREIAEIIKGDEKVIETALSFKSRADTRIDACIDYTRPSLSIDNDQIKGLIIDSLNRGVKLRCITEITTSNVDSCKKLMGIVNELRHLDGIAGTFYVSDTECMIPEVIHKEGKLASQLIYWNVKETVKQQQYVFETLWNKAISGQQKINEIEKGELPEVIEIIRSPNEAQQIAIRLIDLAEKEILVLFSSVNANIRQMNVGGVQRVVKAANSRDLTVTMLTPMNDTLEMLAKDLEKQSTHTHIRRIEPSSRSTVTVLIVDKKFSLAAELKDDSKLIVEEVYWHFNLFNK